MITDNYKTYQTGPENYNSSLTSFQTSAAVGRSSLSNAQHFNSINYKRSPCGLWAGMNSEARSSVFPEGTKRMTRILSCRGITSSLLSPAVRVRYGVHAVDRFEIDEPRWSINQHIRPSIYVLILVLLTISKSYIALFPLFIEQRSRCSVFYVPARIGN